MATWVELTLDEKLGDAPAGTKVYVNLDRAGLIYPRPGKGSDMWFFPDTREHAVKSNEPEWDGHTYVMETPSEIMKRAKNADRP